MNFWEVTAANMVSTAITVIFIVIEALILLGKPGGGDIRYWVRVFGASVLFIVGCAVLGVAMLVHNADYLSDSQCRQLYGADAYAYADHSSGCHEGTASVYVLFVGRFTDVSDSCSCCSA